MTTTETAVSEREAGDDLTAAIENQFGLADRIVDEGTLANSAGRFREQRIVLPTFAQLADPSTMACRRRR